MSRSRGFILIGVLGVIGLSGRAWAQPLSAITASPNPCVIPRGATTCTSYINWFTLEATAAHRRHMGDGVRGQPGLRIGQVPRAVDKKGKFVCVYALRLFPGQARPRSGFRYRHRPERQAAP
jgi:hypothetical protein